MYDVSGFNLLLFYGLYMALDLTAASLIYTPLTYSCQISPSLPPSLPPSLASSFALKSEQKLPCEVNKLLPSIAVVAE